MAADEQLSEEDLDMLESTMRMALGNFENFNGAPYIARLTDKLKEKNIPFKLGKIYNHGCIFNLRTLAKYKRLKDQELEAAMGTEP